LTAGLGRSVRSPGTRGSPVETPNGFSGLIKFTQDTYLALATDGIGSKLMLAAKLGNYESVAIDCVAMNVNDLLCIGAEPLAFVDYIATPKPDPSTHAALGRSLAEGCRQARVTLSGGETATLPEMVKEYDMAGTALGWLPKGSELDGTRIAPGSSKMIGIPSNGIHSNGYSLVRKVLEIAKPDLNSPPPFEATSSTRHEATIFKAAGGDAALTLADVLLNPTRIYVDPVMDLILAARDSASSGPCSPEAIQGMAHITGGGLSNLLRLTPGRVNIGYSISDPLPVHPEFSWIQDAAGVSDYEMYRTFNMGMGMVLVVDEKEVEPILAWLNDRLPGCQVIGAVDDSGKVTTPLSGVEYSEY